MKKKGEKNVTRFDAGRTQVLVELRQQVGLSQDEVAAYFNYQGRKRRDNISNWENGHDRPHRRHRSKFVTYLWEKLKLQDNPTRFYEIWEEVVVGQWQWSPLDRSEWPDYSPYIRPYLPVAPQIYVVGRDSLLTELRQVLCGDMGRVVCALYGKPGVGKSTVAKMLIHDPEVREYFRNSIFWINLGQRANALTALESLGTALGISRNELKHLTTIPDRADRIIKEIGSRRVLLVLDDAWEDDLAVDLRLDCANSVSLLTTRSPTIAIQFAPDKCFSIPELDTDSGELVIRQLASRVATEWPTQIRQLVKDVGGLPQSLVLMGSYLNTQSQPNNWNPRRASQALKRLKDAETRLQLSERQKPHERHTSLPEEARISVEALIALSYDALDDAARATLRAVSVVPAKPNSFSEMAALEVSGQTTKALDMLWDYGLLEADMLGRYTLHPTIADYARARLIDPTIYTRTISFYLRYLEEHVANHNALDLERANILEALNLAFEKGMRSALVRGANTLYHFLETRGLYSIAEIHLKRAEQAAMLDDDPSRATLLLNLGRIAINHGDYTLAEKYLSEGLGLAHKLELPASLISDLLRSLGVAADHQGQYAKAEELYQKSLTLAREISDRQGMIRLLLDLGGLAYDRGDILRSEEYLQEGLKLAREIRDRENISPLLVNLGAIAASRGDYAQEEKLYLEGLAVAREINHPENICFLLTNLGASLNDRGEHVRAKEYFQEGLAIAREIGHRERVSSLLRNLGGALTNVGEYARAEELYQEGLGLAREMKQARNKSAMLADLGALTTITGNYVKAEDYLQEALDLAREIGNDWHISDALNKRGELYLRQQRVDLASADFSESLQIAQRVARELVANALLGLAQVEAARGNSAKAGQQGLESLKIYKAIGHYKAFEVEEWLTQLPGLGSGS